MSGYSRIFHPLNFSGPLPGKLNNPFCYQPDALSLAAAHELQAYLAEAEVNTAEAGKMFGVLVVTDEHGHLGYLAAYSGQVEGLDDGVFVPPVFCYLQPDGYFLAHERQIEQLSRQIVALEESSELKAARTQLAKLEAEAEEVIKEKVSARDEAKRHRDERRRKGVLSVEEQQRMVAESQFLKAEVVRARRQCASRVEAALRQVQSLEATVKALRQERHARSERLQHWLFSHFIVMNARGEQSDLLQVFCQYYASSVLPAERLLPPSGSGECCEPKLLQYAFLHHLRPVRMAMFWWGASPVAEVRRHLHFYPACSSKCKPILSFMLKGLDVEPNPLEESSEDSFRIVAEGQGFVVVDKPAGMLSVQGRSRRESVVSILRRRYPEAMAAHRLDMATSGLLIVATDRRSYVELQRQFLEHSVRKKYVAVVEGVPAKKEGYIRLPLAPDYSDRPRQKVDFVNGKKAVTYYRVIRSEQSEAILELSPLTGRTHQLRLHCAHAMGLGCPIKGDMLYGSPADRLWLHAGELHFVSPVDGKPVSVKSEAPFLKQRT